MLQYVIELFNQIKGQCYNTLLTFILILYSLNFVLFVSVVLSISCIFKITKNYAVMFIKIIRRKQICIINQCFTRYHKVNISNTKITPHYRIICLYTINVCFYVSITNKFFNFFRYMFNTKAIKVINFILFTK